MLSNMEKSPHTNAAINNIIRKKILRKVGQPLSKSVKEAV